MITRNMKNLMACMLQSSANVYGLLPVTDVTGIQKFISPAFSFPNSRTETFSNTAGGAGISFGKGSAAATERDFLLQSTITSGITVTQTGNQVGMENGCPYHKFTFTVVNTGSAELTITEVGYKQTIKACTLWGATSAADAVVLMDRTVLSTPLTIQAGDAGILVYKLKTVPQAQS